MLSNVSSSQLMSSSFKCHSQMAKNWASDRFSDAKLHLHEQHLRKVTGRGKGIKIGEGEKH